MADPTTVKRALHALANGEYAGGTDGTSVSDPQTVITAATDALTSVDEAATFCERFGLDALRTATRTAAGRGDDGLASRGRDSLDSLTAYRQVATGDDVTAVGTEPSADAADDHFHHARGTPLPRAGQRGDR